MAGKGGGAWKVAYADFVTAMMAFFLVMWLCAQDQKVKETVADYFLDPFGGAKLGLSTRPNHFGSISGGPNTGSVPEADSVPHGRGRNPYVAHDDASIATKWVADWLHRDQKAGDHWRKQAQRAREDAFKTKSAGFRSKSNAQAAVRQLSEQMREEITRQMPVSTNRLYQDLLAEVISRINWDELAEDLLGE
jgi:chemotaxis protein MotB